SIVPEYINITGHRVTISNLIDLDITHNLPTGNNYDLIICSNVINELETSIETRSDLIHKLCISNLSHDGSLIIIEPADFSNSCLVRNISRTLKSHGLTLYAPCNDIRGVPCKVMPCWTFKEYSNINPTQLMKTLSDRSGNCNEEGYKFVNTDVKFSYAIIRKDGKRRCEYRIPPYAKCARLSQLKRHIGRRITVTVSVMSSDIGDSDTYMYLVCDGTGNLPVYLALPAHHRNNIHDVLLSSTYGSVITVESVLVIYNSKHDSYNLLVGPNSVTRLIDGKLGSLIPIKKRVGNAKKPKTVYSSNTKVT
ncbi:MAG TPA: hypothetical protein O0X14_00745, partial [Methanocorpusculum sp.]|nr:hypothetical protein [Methanocorpusculum sp.]